jgi:hypothetical protein
MAYNGYANEATYYTALMVDNERDLYFAVRAIAREHRNAARSAPFIRSLVTRTLRGDTRLLTESQRRAWQKDIRSSGGLRAVDWTEIAESEGEDRRKHARGRAARRVEAARRPRHAATVHRHSHR